MKPESPLTRAALLAASTLALFAAPALAQSTTTVTETTTVEKRVYTQPQEVITTLEFQPASTANDLNLRMLRDFESVKQTDPKVALDIAAHPEVVENQSYVRQHPALQAFLNRYPNASAEIMDSPGNFVTPVASSRWNSHEVAGIARDSDYAAHATSPTRHYYAPHYAPPVGPSTVVAEEGSTVVEKHGNDTTELEFKPASSARDLNTQMLRDFESVKASDPAIAREIAKDPALVQNSSYVSKHPSLQAFLQRYPNARDEIVDSPGNFVTPVKGSTWNSHEAAGIPRD